MASIRPRKQSRSVNKQVYWRANQFPGARMGVSNLTGCQPKTDEQPETDRTEEEQQKLDYLKNRFKSTDTSGVDGPTGPCGE